MAQKTLQSKHCRCTKILEYTECWKYTMVWQQWHYTEPFDMNCEHLRASNHTRNSLPKQSYPFTLTVFISIFFRYIFPNAINNKLFLHRHVTTGCIPTTFIVDTEIGTNIKYLSNTSDVSLLSIIIYLGIIFVESHIMKVNDL